MLMPNQSESIRNTRIKGAIDAGVSPSFCTPCVLGKQICGLPFSPHVVDCAPTCVDGPCVPFLNKKLRCCVPGGCSLVDC